MRRSSDKIRSHAGMALGPNLFHLPTFCVKFAIASRCLPSKRRSPFQAGDWRSPSGHSKHIEARTLCSRQRPSKCRCSGCDRASRNKRRFGFWSTHYRWQVIRCHPNRHGARCAPISKWLFCPGIQWDRKPLCRSTLWHICMRNLRPIGCFDQLWRKVGSPMSANNHLHTH